MNKRRYKVETVSNTGTLSYSNKTAAECFSFEELSEQISDPDTDCWITLDQLLALGAGDSLRFGGGAAPLFELRRIADCRAEWRVSLRKYRSTWHWFTTNPQGGGFGSNHCGAKRVAYDHAMQNIPRGALVEVVTEHNGQQIKRELITV